VSRIDVLAFLQELEVLLPFSLATADRGGDVTDLAVVRQRGRRDAKFLQRLVVIRLGPVVIEPEGEVSFAEVALELEGLLGVALDLRLALVRRIEPMINPRESGGEPRIG